MSIRRLKCIKLNIHFLHNIQNRRQDVEWSLGIDTLNIFDFRCLLDVYSVWIYALYTIYRIDTEMLSQVREYTLYTLLTLDVY